LAQEVGTAFGDWIALLDISYQATRWQRPQGVCFGMPRLEEQLNPIDGTAHPVGVLLPYGKLSGGQWLAIKTVRTA
jgi:hypothetical protein